MRVGANSPSLWPIICSVTIHGNKFLAVVHGDRVTDHVRHDRGAPRPRLHHFLFVARVQSSTFSRRWPSTKGPFFVERAIASLFLHAAQTAPLGVPHLFKSPHRTRYSVRLRTERANKTRAQCIRRTIHDRPTSPACKACTAPVPVARPPWLRVLRQVWPPQFSPHAFQLSCSTALPDASCVLHRVLSLSLASFRSPQPVLNSPAGNCDCLTLPSALSLPTAPRLVLTSC